VEDPVEASRADIEFHEVFVSRSKNSYLVSILRDLKISYRRVEVTYFEKDASGKYSLDEHSRIIEALQQGDLEQSQTMIRLNWQNSLQRLQQLASKRNESITVAGDH
jgi:DNA-binding GntR family transcriptional regulator